MSAPALPPDTGLRTSFSASQMELGEVAKLFPSMGIPWQVADEIAHERIALQTETPVSRDELMWSLRAHLGRIGLELEGSRWVRRGPHPAGSPTCRVARTREASAEGTARFAERNWRGLVHVTHRDDLVLLSGEADVVNEAVATLYVRDYLARDPLQ